MPATPENTPLLTTDRLTLRRFRSTDAPALFALLRDRTVNKFLPWFPFDSLAQTERHLQQFYLDFYHFSPGYRYAVCLQSGPLISYVHVGGPDSYDLGYALGKKYWHQGYTVEACHAVIARVKQDGLPFLTATHDVFNPASGGVMRKLGMVYQYSFEELWQPKKLSVTFRMYQLDLDGHHDHPYQGYRECHSSFIEKW